MLSFLSHRSLSSRPTTWAARQLACGHSHSLALVLNEESLRENVYVWGLGSSGQLGIPRESLHEKKLSPLPQKLRLDPSLKVLSICSGPLSHHTFLIVARAGAGTGAAAPGGYPGREASSPRASMPLRHSLHTAIDADELLHTLRTGHIMASSKEVTPNSNFTIRWEYTKMGLSSGPGIIAICPLRSLKGSEGVQQTALVKAVGAAFSSVSVLNASFRRPSPLGTTAESSGVDLLKVGSWLVCGVCFLS